MELITSNSKSDKNDLTLKIQQLNSDLFKTKQDYETKLSEMQNEINSIEKARQGLISKLAAQAASFEKEKNELLKDGRETKAKLLERIEKENLEHQKETNALHNKINDLIQEKLKQKEDFNKQMDNANKNKNDLQKENALLKQEVETVMVKIENYKNKEDDLNDNISKLNKQVCHLQEEKSKVEQSNKELKENLQKTDDEHKEKERNANELEQTYKNEINTLKLKLDNVEKDKKTNQHKKNALLHDIKIEQEKNKTLTTQLSELEELVSKLQKEIETKTEQIQVLEQKREESNEEINQLELLRKQKEFFQKENHKFKEEIFQLNNTVTSLQETNNKLKEDYLNFQEESKINSSILQEEYQKLHEEISSLKKQSQPPLISPQTHQILANKPHDKLTWYLLKLKEPPSDSSPYNGFTWIPHSQIEQTLKQYNAFVSEEEAQAKLMQSYLLKAEKREEVISQLTYKVQKLTELSGISLSNSGIANPKTSKSRQSDNAITISQENIDLAILNKTNPTIINTNKKSSQIDSNALMAKYNNSLLKIAELEEQVTKYQKIILKSRTEGR